VVAVEAARTLLSRECFSCALLSSWPANVSDSCGQCREDQPIGEILCAFTVGPMIYERKRDPANLCLLGCVVRFVSYS
jgi:hypothetical protein